MTEIICVPLIVTIVYALIEGYKKIVAKKNEILVRIIPIIGLCLGAVLGVVCFYAFPELIIAHNLLSAIVVGASSGLSATGCNQIFKQLKNYGITITEPNDTNAADKNELNSYNENEVETGNKEVNNKEILASENDNEIKNEKVETSNEKHDNKEN